MRVVGWDESEVNEETVDNEEGLQAWCLFGKSELEHRQEVIRRRDKHNFGTPRMFHCSVEKQSSPVIGICACLKIVAVSKSSRSWPAKVREYQARPAGRVEDGRSSGVRKRQQGMHTCMQIMGRRQEQLEQLGTQARAKEND